MRANFTISCLIAVLLLGMVSIPLNAQTFTFKNPLPIPYIMNGTQFNIDITGGQHNFDPNGAVTNINLNVPLASYTYNETGNTGMSYLGPTLVFKKGDDLSFDIFNDLPERANTTVHWHGLNIPAQDDGGPHQVIFNQTNWKPDFTMIDQVQTAWYHTHLMDLTTIQVIKGLAGLIIVEDDDDPLSDQLPHDYGENDFPIIIQEKGFNLDSMTTPPTATSLIVSEKPGFGPYTLINGVVGAVLRVPPEVVRLRILNGSPRNMFSIGLSTELENPTTFADMWLIATGGGYIPESMPMDSTLMSVGDRREFLVDFSQYNNGDTVYMSNLTVPSDALYTNRNKTPTPGNAFMAFIVDNTLGSTDPIFTIPSILDTNYGPLPGQLDNVRTKKLEGGNGQVWTIDGTGMNLNVINDTVLVNTKERWNIINTTNHAHPFHIHKVQFQVVEYIGKAGYSEVDSTYNFPDLPDELVGYKDVQLIRANATMSFEARFDSFPSPLLATEGYMYHCHILTHEDTSMMHQFVVVDSMDFFSSINDVPGTEPLTAYPNPAMNTISFKGDFNYKGSLRFYDMQGKLLRRDNDILISESPIPVYDLPRGIVVVVFNSRDGHFVGKVTLH